MTEMGRLGAVFEAACGRPTADEAAAVLAAVQAVLESESAPARAHVPWPYRSAWRRAAIEEGVGIAHPPDRPAGAVNDRGGIDVP